MRTRFLVLAAISLLAAIAPAATTQTAEQKPTPLPSAVRPQLGGLPADLAVLKNYRSMRSSSADRPGNFDCVNIAPGETKTIADLSGPGEIAHIWNTIATGNQNHLRDLVLRIYWDGNTFPSVESPIGDFFGCGHARYYYFNNPVQAVGTENALNCFWPMPFGRSARVTVENQGAQKIDAFYYYVDWRKFDQLPPQIGYFHAQYRQAFPNANGKPYLILDTDGAQGHYCGVNLSIHTQVAGWWGEGDDIMTIDGETTPSLWGTGSEDYFCGAWCYGDAFFRDYFGLPYRERKDHGADNRWNVYRLHLESPIAFQKSLKVEIEHGAGGFDETRPGKNNNYASCAYWYMAKPTALKGTLPPAADRISKYEPPPKPAVPEGVFEAQYLVPPQPTGLNLAPQDMGAFAAKNGSRWLHNDQLFCDTTTPTKAADLVFETTAPLAGEAVLRVTKAPDYGRVRIQLDGKTVASNVNGYAKEVIAETVPLGRVSLANGKHTLRITVVGKDPKASASRWGLDYLRIGGTPPDIENASAPQAAQACQALTGSRLPAAGE